MNPSPHTPPSWLARLGLAVLTVVLLAAGVVLSAFFFALLLVLAAVGGIWLWWQRRRLRRHARPGQGDFIEVEYEVLEQDRTRKERIDRAGRDRPPS